MSAWLSSWMAGVGGSAASTAVAEPAVDAAALHGLGGLDESVFERAEAAAAEEDAARAPSPLQRLEKLFGAEEFTTVARDGTELRCSVKRGRPDAQVMLVFAPLGQANMMSYWCIMQHLGDAYTYVSWQYRGFFDSELPKRARRVSVRDHAEDGRDVLARAHALGMVPYDFADVALSHSKGVQVSLEFVLLYPALVHAQIMISGSYGSVFHQAFQMVPFVRVPFASSFADWLVDKLVMGDPTKVVNAFKAVMTSDVARKGLTFIGDHFGHDGLVKELGSTYQADMLSVYFEGVSSNRHSSVNWLRGFQELNAHSVKHLLHLIQQPTLLLSGRWDYLTPSYVMEEMAQRMPNAEHKVCYHATHFGVIEAPEWIVQQVDQFLVANRTPQRFKRLDSTTFVLEGEPPAPDLRDLRAAAA